MPYAKIVFIKLFLSLFDEDDRFLYRLNESQQLLYLKLLVLAGTTLNQIPKNFSFIKNKINYSQDMDCLASDISRIMTVFPQFTETEDFYKFNKFDELHNFIGYRELQRNSKGTPIPSKRSHQKEKEKEKEKENKKEKKDATPHNFLEKLKSNPAYRGIDIDRELGKCQAWIEANRPGSQLTHKRFVNWLNRAEKPISFQKTYTPPPKDKTVEQMEQWKKEASPMPEECREQLARFGIRSEK